MRFLLYVQMSNIYNCFDITENKTYSQEYNTNTCSLYKKKIKYVQHGFQESF